MILEMKMSKRTSMNLFEIMDAVDQLVERVEKVEQLAHEPQNWIHGMSLEKRINKLEQKLKTLIRYKK